jgi:molybdenum cofactor guanylyltransferase
MISPVLNGLILSGGKSLRMGYDKALIAYHGKPQREHVFELLNPFCNQVYTSCKGTEDIPEGLNPLPDRYDFDSPLNGILTAFATGADQAWLTIPVDMPMIDAEVIEYILHHRNPEKVATCFYDSAGKLPEPLLTLWEPSAGKKLLAYYSGGGISPREFLMQEEINLLQSPHPKYLLNVNSPGELELILKSYIETD